MLIVELNEFNRDFLEKGANILNLKNLKYILKLNSCKTYSPEYKEHHGLDPWVQWVSIHTGKELKQHKIIRNSDIKKLKFKQFWEILSEKGISSGIWGALNANRNNSKLCYFFLPDPWNYNELAYPKNLNEFLYLPRYYSKNYTKISKFKFIFGIIKLIKFLLNPSLIFGLVGNFVRVIKYVSADGINNNNLFGLFDLISTEVFLKYKEKYNPNVSVIFLNSIAHFQHHYWDKNYLNKKAKISLEILDVILGKFLKKINPEEPLLILNGLSQKNVKDRGYFIYKQISADKFLKDLKIKYSKVEQCMTSDGHIKFETKEDLEKGKYILDNILIENKNLFYTENISYNKKFILFWQIDFYRKIRKNSHFSFLNNNYSFHKYFVLIAERSGSHISSGEIICRHFILPKEIKNNEFFDYLLSYFKLRNRS